MQWSDTSPAFFKLNSIYFGSPIDRAEVKFLPYSVIRLLLSSKNLRRWSFLNSIQDDQEASQKENSYPKDRESGRPEGAKVVCRPDRENDSWPDIISPCAVGPRCSQSYGAPHGDPSACNPLFQTMANVFRNVIPTNLKTIWLWQVPWEWRICYCSQGLKLGRTWELLEPLEDQLCTLEFILIRYPKTSKDTKRLREIRWMTF